MFNTAFAVGGAQCTIQTVEELTGIYIDHFVTVDFNGFKDMVDAVDGVEVCIPKDVDDDEHDIHLDAGTQELDRRGGAQLRARAPRPLAHRRHRPDEAAAGVHRLDGQQGDVGRHPVPARPGLLLPRRGHRLDRGRRGPRLARRSCPTWPPSSGTPGWRASSSSRSRSRSTQPDPNRLVWTAEAKDLWKRIRADEPLGEDFSEDSLSADDPVGTPEGSSSGDGGSGGEGADDEERLAAGLCA